MPNLVELTEALKIDRFNLDVEVEQQPSLFWKVGEAAEITRSKMDQAEAALKKLEAELDKQLRETPEEKQTETSISKAILRHPERIAAHQEYLDLKLRTGKLDKLVESFRQRSKMLEQLSSLQISGYYQRSSTGRSVELAKTARAEYNQERMNQRRRSRLRPDA